MRFICLLLVLLFMTPCVATSASPSKGQSITTARQILLYSGWKPRRTNLMWGEQNNEPENQWGDAGALYKAGFIEVETCSGTGKNFCFFNYERKGKCLRLTTQGEFNPGKYEPMVIKKSPECPPSEALESQKYASP